METKSNVVISRFGQEDFVRGISGIVVVVATCENDDTSVTDGHPGNSRNSAIQRGTSHLAFTRPNSSDST